MSIRKVFVKIDLSKSAENRKLMPRNSVGYMTLGRRNVYMIMFLVEI